MKIFIKSVLCFFIPINTWAILDIHSDTGKTYTLSRNDNYLYSVDSQTGELTQTGNNHFTGMEYVSFRPDDGLCTIQDHIGYLKIEYLSFFIIHIISTIT